MHFRHYSVSALLFILFSVWGSAQAATPKFSIGLNGGKTRTSLDIDTPPGVSVSAKGGAAFGLSLGYSFSETATIELELMKGASTISANGPGGSISTDTDIETKALYFTQRTEGDLYFKFKLGIISEEISGTGAPTETGTGTSYGAGGGFRFNEHIALEAEYTLVEQDVSWLLLSARISF